MQRKDKRSCGPKINSWCFDGRVLQGESINRLRRDLPKEYSTFYVACDCYTEISIKGCERGLRGQSERSVIRNTDIRTPPDFKNFMNSGVNKEKLVELVEEVWTENSGDLGDKVIFLRRRMVALTMSAGGTERVYLICRQITRKLILKYAIMLHHAHQQNQADKTIGIVRLHSGDINIVILRHCQPACQ